MRTTLANKGQAFLSLGVQQTHEILAPANYRGFPYSIGVANFAPTFLKSNENISKNQSDRSVLLTYI